MLPVPRYWKQEGATNLVSDLPSKDQWTSKTLTSGTPETPAHGGAGSIPEITASLSQLGSNHSAYMPPQYDVVAAGTWKQRTARVCDEIRGVIESIESVNSEIRQDFDTLGDQNAGLTDFEDYEVLFDLTVNELKLTGRIEEIFRTKWTSVAPPIRISEVDEITARLSEILATLEGAKLDFHPVSSIIARPTVKSKKNLRPRAQVSHKRIMAVSSSIVEILQALAGADSFSEIHLRIGATFILTDRCSEIHPQAKTPISSREVRLVNQGTRKVER